VTRTGRAATPRRALGLAALSLASLAAAGCRTTPDEIRAIRAENELLREQIQALKDRCEMGREIEVRPEDRREQRREPPPNPSPAGC
jgi:hypothetical protein